MNENNNNGQNNNNEEQNSTKDNFDENNEEMENGEEDYEEQNDEYNQEGEGEEYDEGEGEEGQGEGEEEEQEQQDEGEEYENNEEQNYEEEMQGQEGGDNGENEEQNQNQNLPYIPPFDDRINDLSNEFDEEEIKQLNIANENKKYEDKYYNPNVNIKDEIEKRKSSLRKQQERQQKAKKNRNFITFSNNIDKSEIYKNAKENIRKILIEYYTQNENSEVIENEEVSQNISEENDLSVNSNNNNNFDYQEEADKIKEEKSKKEEENIENNVNEIEDENKKKEEQNEVNNINNNINQEVEKEKEKENIENNGNKINDENNNLDNPNNEIVENLDKNAKREFIPINNQQYEVLHEIEKLKQERAEIINQLNDLYRSPQMQQALPIEQRYQPNQPNIYETIENLQNKSQQINEVLQNIDEVIENAIEEQKQIDKENKLENDNKKEREKERKNKILQFSKNNNLKQEQEIVKNKIKSLEREIAEYFEKNEVNIGDIDLDDFKNNENDDINIDDEIVKINFISSELKKINNIEGIDGEEKKPNQHLDFIKKIEKNIKDIEDIAIDSIDKEIKNNEIKNEKNSEKRKINDKVNSYQTSQKIIELFNRMPECEEKQMIRYLIDVYNNSDDPKIEFNVDKLETSEIEEETIEISEKVLDGNIQLNEKLIDKLDLNLKKEDGEDDKKLKQQSDAINNNKKNKQKITQKYTKYNHQEQNIKITNNDILEILEKSFGVYRFGGFKKENGYNREKQKWNETENYTNQYYKDKISKFQNDNFKNAFNDVFSQKGIKFDKKHDENTNSYGDGKIDFLLENAFDQVKTKVRESNTVYDKTYDKNNLKQQIREENKAQQETEGKKYDIEIQNINNDNKKQNKPQTFKTKYKKATIKNKKDFLSEIYLSKDTIGNDKLFTSDEIKKLGIGNINFIENQNAVKRVIKKYEKDRYPTTKEQTIDNFETEMDKNEPELLESLKDNINYNDKNFSYEELYTNCENYSLISDYYNKLIDKFNNIQQQINELQKQYDKENNNKILNNIRNLKDEQKEIEQKIENIQALRSIDDEIDKLRNIREGDNVEEIENKIQYLQQCENELKKNIAQKFFTELMEDEIPISIYHIKAILLLEELNENYNNIDINSINEGAEEIFNKVEKINNIKTGTKDYFELKEYFVDFNIRKKNAVNSFISNNILQQKLISYNTNQAIKDTILDKYTVDKINNNNFSIKAISPFDKDFKDIMDYLKLYDVNGLYDSDSLEKEQFMIIIKKYLQTYPLIDTNGEIIEYNKIISSVEEELHQQKKNEYENNIIEAIKKDVFEDDKKITEEEKKNFNNLENEKQNKFLKEKYKDLYNKLYYTSYIKEIEFINRQNSDIVNFIVNKQNELKNAKDEIKNKSFDEWKIEKKNEYIDKFFKEFRRGKRNMSKYYDANDKEKKEIDKTIKEEFEKKRKKNFLKKIEERLTKEEYEKSLKKEEEEFQNQIKRTVEEKKNIEVTNEEKNDAVEHISDALHFDDKELQNLFYKNYHNKDEFNNDIINFIKNKLIKLGNEYSNNQVVLSFVDENLRNLHDEKFVDVIKSQFWQRYTANTNKVKNYVKLKRKSIVKTNNKIKNKEQLKKEIKEIVKNDIRQSVEANVVDDKINFGVKKIKDGIVNETLKNIDKMEQEEKERIEKEKKEFEEKKQKEEIDEILKDIKETIDNDDNFVKENNIENYRFKNSLHQEAFEKLEEDDKYLKDLDKLLYEVKVEEDNQKNNQKYKKDKQRNFDISIDDYNEKELNNTSTNISMEESISLN